MKRRLLVIVVFVFSTLMATAQTTEKHGVKWFDDYNKAQIEAKKEGKPMLVFFTGSDWCGPCKLLVKDFFSTEKFKHIATEKFVMYEANFPRNRDLISSSQKEDNLALKLKFQVSSFPTVLLLNVKGKEVGRESGFNYIHDTTKHFSLLESVL
ncbi:MAG: thioredoxin [Flavobacteriaceae bacterium]|nr:MAG: thioredoxin [Flavobacteriaceae bacterium]